MPAYDYKCPECESVGEVVHKMDEKPVYLCPQCDVVMKRVYNSFGVNHGETLSHGKVVDHFKKEADMKQEMKEDYGIEGFKPITAKNMKEVYDDVKSQGSFVKERMQAQVEQNAAAKKKKSREWMTKAMKRAPERSIEKVERKKAEEAKKRAIRI